MAADDWAQLPRAHLLRCHDTLQQILARTLRHELEHTPHRAAREAALKGRRAQDAGRCHNADVEVGPLGDGAVRVDEDAVRIAIVLRGGAVSSGPHRRSASGAETGADVSTAWAGRRHGPELSAATARKGELAERARVEGDGCP